MRTVSRRVLLLGGLGGFVAAPAAAQTRADSAAIVLEAARALANQGQQEAARRLFLLIRSRYAGTDGARTADSILGTLGGAPPSPGQGHTGFVLFHTLYGAFLGAAIPGAVGADGPEPYGVGLLLGAPLGFFGSRAFARAQITMPGQAGIASFATTWGTLQGLLLQVWLGLGDEESCNQNGCFRDESDTAPWLAMVVGGLAGLGTGLGLATREIPSKTSTLIAHSAFWGTWFGYTAGFVLGLEDDSALGTALLGGNAGLVLAIPAARAWQTTSARIRLTTAAGLAGALAGFGIDLLAQPDDDRVVAGIPAATSAIGLVLGAALTRNDREGGESDAAGHALLTIRDRARWGFPLPVPAAIPTPERRRVVRPGLRFFLLDAAF